MKSIIQLLYNTCLYRLHHINATEWPDNSVLRIGDIRVDLHGVSTQNDSRKHLNGYKYKCRDRRKIQGNHRIRET